MPASPATAPMLSEAERAALVGALAAVHQHEAEAQQVGGGGQPGRQGGWR